MGSILSLRHYSHDQIVHSHDHARSRRLHQAHELLLESSLAVGEIAARVGYASQSAFTAALVREFGVTPRQLRRESRDKTG